MTNNLIQNPSTTGDIAALSMGLILFVVGLLCLFWPEKIQRYVLNSYERNNTLKKFNPLLNWMHTSAYITSLRIIGLMAIGGLILILYGLLLTIHN